MKHFLRTVKKHIFSKNNSELFLKKLKKRGITVGNHTYFFDPKSNIIDYQRPWLIKIGDYCKISHGVVILAHDYSRSVLRRVYGEIIGEAAITKIGDNVFIGINSVILMGSHIGNNVIIGAGSVVRGEIPDNVVVLGNPAKVVCTIEDYYFKRKNKFINEAKLCAREFFHTNGRYPTIVEMGAFFPLFLPRTHNDIKLVNTKLNGDDEEEIIDYLMKTEPVYSSFDDFIKDAFKELNEQ